MESRNDTAAEKLIIDYRQAGLSAEDQALCEYAIKLTLTPGAMTASDIDSLRAHGFSDAAITIAAQVISYFNYINRIADGLGVDAEDWMRIDEAEWRRQKGKMP